MKSVVRFIPVIRTVLDQHRRNGVASVKFNPLELNLNLQTAMARLRDSVHSLCEGLTEHGSIDKETLKQVWPLYKVTSDGANVMVVSRDVPVGESNITIIGSNESLATLKTDEAGFVEAITAFAVLMGQRYLRGQVDIIGDLSDSLRHRIESENDVVFIPDGQNKHHMI